MTYTPSSSGIDTQWALTLIALLLLMLGMLAPLAVMTTLALVLSRLIDLSPVLTWPYLIIGIGAPIIYGERLEHWLRKKWNVLP